MAKSFPEIRALGLDSAVIRFSDRLADPANRAALTFASLVRDADIAAVSEVAPSLTSCLVRFDPFAIGWDEICAKLQEILDSRDWGDTDLPAKRRLWRIPVLFGDDFGPQSDAAAALAGVSVSQMQDEIAAAQVRVLALGFAPGQPYMGLLPDRFDIARQSHVTPEVPAGALVIAVRQLIIFSGPAPTGWHQIGLSGFRPFRPDAKDPITLAPGDEVTFERVSSGDLGAIDGDGDGLGGATCETLE